MGFIKVQFMGSTTWFSVIMQAPIKQVLCPDPPTYTARKGPVKRVVLPCPHAANGVGQIRLQKHGHMTALKCN